MSDPIQNGIPDRGSPGLTSPAPCVRLPGHTSDKLATGKRRRTWTRVDNVALMESYFLSRPQVRGYMKRMKEFWDLRVPNSALSEKQLVAQKANIVKKELLSTLEVEEIEQRVCPRVVATQAVPSEHVPQMQPVASQEVQALATIDSRLEGLRDDIIKHLPMAEDRLRLPKLPKATVVPDQLITDVNEVLVVGVQDRYLTLMHSSTQQHE